MFRRRIALLLAAAITALGLTVGVIDSFNRPHTASQTHTVALNPNPDPTEPPLTPTPDHFPHPKGGG